MPLQASGRARIRVLLIVVSVGAGMAAWLWSLDRRSPSEKSPVNSDRAGRPTGSLSETPAPASPAAASSGSSPVSVSNSAPSPGNDPISAAGGIVFTPELMIPVAGVRSDQLLDTFADARSEGRVHDAIDILAPAGTAVVAAADGEIIKLFQSERGGTTIYQLSTDKKLVFYYAHLQRYAEGLAVGKFVKQGEVIAHVGDTGNAGAGNFHLHFSISIVADPKRYWEGANINPYPLLRK